MPTVDHDPDKRRWPLPASAMRRRRASRELDELLTRESKYPDLGELYPRVTLREVA
jgi:hypothetical protein